MQLGDRVQFVRDVGVPHDPLPGHFFRYFALSGEIGVVCDVSAEGERLIVEIINEHGRTIALVDATPADVRIDKLP